MTCPLTEFKLLLDHLPLAPLAFCFTARRTQTCASNATARHYYAARIGRFQMDKLFGQGGLRSAQYNRQIDLIRPAHDHVDNSRQ